MEILIASFIGFIIFRFLKNSIGSLASIPPEIDPTDVFVGLMTFILILSSVTMVLAVEAGHRMDRQGVEKWMVWTIFGGLVFLGCQAWEWSHFIHGTDAGSRLLDGSIIYGANLQLNQYGPPDFAAFFFFITGFHGFHVFSGVALNFLIFYQATVGILERRGHYEMVEKVGLYWHFVLYDVVWDMQFFHINHIQPPPPVFHRK